MMGTRRTGLQINNRTSRTITHGFIHYNIDAVADNELDLFFYPAKKEKRGTKGAMISGPMRLEPNTWAEHFVEIYDHPGHHFFTIQLSFDNGQTVDFSCPSEAVFEDISVPRTLKSKASGSSANPIRPAISCWTRHDEATARGFKYGMITFNVDEAPATTRWMGNNWATLSNRKLNELSIPGTHDTGTWTVTGNAQCQVMDVRTQLNAGIRFLDIRLELLSGLGTDKLEIYHGLSPMGVYFSDVLAACQDFLSENPNEAIIMMISRNKHFLDSVVDIARDILAKFFGTTATDEYFADSVKTILDKYPGLFLSQPTVPTLNDAKGKVVLTNRYAGGPGIPLGTGWPDDTAGTFAVGGVTVHVQDVYGYGFLWEKLDDDPTRLSKIDRKWSFFEQELQAANAAGRDPGRWTINYSSASGPPTIMNPDQFAKGVGGANGVNDRLLAYLQAHPKAYYGTVPMDFPEYPNNGEIIRRLIDSNL